MALSLSMPVVLLNLIIYQVPGAQCSTYMVIPTGFNKIYTQPSFYHTVIPNGIQCGLTLTFGYRVTVRAIWRIVLGNSIVVGMT